VIGVLGQAQIHLLNMNRPYSDVLQVHTDSPRWRDEPKK